jgi:plasmid stability protein
VKRKKKTPKDKIPVSVLLPAGLQKAIAVKAQKNGRSFSAEVRQALKQDLNIDGTAM